MLMFILAYWCMSSIFVGHGLKKTYKPVSAGECSSRWRCASFDSSSSFHRADPSDCWLHSPGSACGRLRSLPCGDSPHSCAAAEPSLSPAVSGLTPDLSCYSSTTHKSKLKVFLHATSLRSQRWNALTSSSSSLVIFSRRLLLLLYFCSSSSLACISLLSCSSRQWSFFWSWVENEAIFTEYANHKLLNKLYFRQREGEHLLLNRPVG